MFDSSDKARFHELLQKEKPTKEEMNDILWYCMHFRSFEDGYCGRCHEQVSIFMLGMCPDCLAARTAYMLELKIFHEGEVKKEENNEENKDHIRLLEIYKATQERKAEREAQVNKSIASPTLWERFANWIYGGTLPSDEHV